MTVRATGDGITIARPHHPRQRPAPSFRRTPFALVAAVQRERSEPTSRSTCRRTLQGKQLGITAFADRSGRTRRLRRADDERDVARRPRNARRSTRRCVVYGRTYALPQQGTIGDIAVDAARGNVFLSNTDFNLLEVWQQLVGEQGLRADSVAVGSLPWGMFMSNNPGHAARRELRRYEHQPRVHRLDDASALHEDLAPPHPDAQHLHRTRSRCSATRTPARSASRLTGRSATRIARSTSRSRRAAASSTRRVPRRRRRRARIRWLDPSLPVPDPRQIWQYGTFAQARRSRSYALFNVDSIARRRDAADVDGVGHALHLGPPVRPEARAVDRRHRTRFRSTPSPRLVAGGSDAEAVLRPRHRLRLPLTDTTFVAASGNRNWIAFGEGHTAGAGRVDHGRRLDGPVPNFFSPLVTISDLTDNASEQVFGLALDINGGTVASHGSQSYFAVGQRSVPPSLAGQVRLVRRRRRHRLPSDRRRHADAGESAARLRRRGERRRSKSSTSPTTSTAARCSSRTRSTDRSARRCRCRAIRPTSSSSCSRSASRVWSSST